MGPGNPRLFRGFLKMKLMEVIKVKTIWRTMGMINIARENNRYELLRGGPPVKTRMTDRKSRGS